MLTKTTLNLTQSERNQSFTQDGPGSSDTRGTELRGSITDYKEMLEAEKKDFFESLLPALDKKLRDSGHKYFGIVLSIADITYYCEISTILLLGAREINKGEMPHLHEWYYTSMHESSHDLKELDQLFLDTLAKNKK